MDVERKRLLKVKFTCTVEVDMDAWEQLYASFPHPSASDVRADVQIYLENAVDSLAAAEAGAYRRLQPPAPTA